MQELHCKKEGTSECVSRKENIIEVKRRDKIVTIVVVFASNQRIFYIHDL